jgi:predicted enzyme related to lactoylglutathione lyase
MSNECTGFNPDVNPGVGEICWHEIPVMCVKRASDFYSAVLGWDIDLKGMPSPMSSESFETIHMFNKGSTNGALIVVSDEALISRDADPARPAKGGAVTTFRVENIAETLKKIEACGGKCHM